MQHLLGCLGLGCPLPLFLPNCRHSDSGQGPMPGFLRLDWDTIYCNLEVMIQVSDAWLCRMIQMSYKSERQSHH